MSSQSIASERSSKKRKHDGDSETKKKKRKNEATATAEEQLDEPRSSKKEKSKKDRSIVESRAREQSPIEDVHSTSTSEKKKKKKAKDSEATQSVQDETTTLVNSHHDTEMIDDSAIENGLSHEDPEATMRVENDEITSDQLLSTTPSAFQATRMSIYLPIPAIASSSILSALLTVHISPLLLNFFPPAGGVVLSYNDPVLSGSPQKGAGKPSLPPDQASKDTLSEVYSTLGEEFGASWVWLTITLLVFKPEAGSELTGFTNAMSEGFLGLVSYNYFQTSIPKSRIPKSWSWNGPSRQNPRAKMITRKGILNDSDNSQETLVDSQEHEPIREDEAGDGIAGTFLDAENIPVPEDLKFRVVDLEMIQAQERGRQYALQLEGTLLDEAEERQLREEEKLKWEARMDKHKSRSRTPGTTMMSGGLATHSRAGSVISTA